MQITEVLTTSKIIVKTFQKLGVDAVFGYPGRAVLGIYDELSKQNDIKHYLLRNDSREKGSPKWQMWQDIQEIRRAYDQMD